MKTLKYKAYDWVNEDDLHFRSHHTYLYFIQPGIVKDARDYDWHYLTRQFNSIGISKLAPPILYLASFNIPGCISSINYVKISTIVAKPLQIKNNVFFLKDLLYYIIFSYTTSIAYTLKFQHYYTYTIMLISCNFLTFPIIRLRFFAYKIYFIRCIRYAAEP